MATFSAITRQHVLQALTEYDDRGKDAFIGVYGFEPAGVETLAHEGRTYDACAVVGVAHRHATGRTARPDELAGREDSINAVLAKTGFEVRQPMPAKRTAAARTTARTATTGATARAVAGRAAERTSTTRTRRASAEERPAAICPTCFTQLPATGVCDACA